MAGVRVKICLDCRKTTPSNKTSCQYCKKDLKGRPLSEEEAEKQLEELARKEQEEAEAAEETAEQEVSATGEETQLTYYRLCDCGHRNPVAASYCEQCGESLEGLMIMSAEELSGREALQETPQLGQRVMLFSHDSQLRLNICGRVVLGANNEGAAYFYNRGYVGGCHAAITAEQDGVYLEDLNSKNGTFVNGSKILPGQRVRLENGTEICLGGTEGNGVRQKSAYLTLEIGV